MSLKYYRIRMVDGRPNVDDLKRVGADVSLEPMKRWEVFAYKARLILGLPRRYAVVAHNDDRWVIAKRP